MSLSWLNKDTSVSVSVSGAATAVLLVSDKNGMSDVAGIPGKEETKCDF